MQDHVILPYYVGTIQYIEWLILINRAQPSFIAGVAECESCARGAATEMLAGSEVDEPPVF